MIGEQLHGWLWYPGHEWHDSLITRVAFLPAEARVTYRIDEDLPDPPMIVLGVGNFRPMDDYDWILEWMSRHPAPRFATPVPGTTDYRIAA